MVVVKSFFSFFKRTCLSYSVLKFVCFLLFLFIIKNSNANSIELSNGSKIYFYVQNEERDFPKTVLDKLTNIPNGDLSDALIFILISQEKYGNVSVKKVKNSFNEDFYVYAENEQIIKRIYLQGLSTQEQVLYLRDLSTQIGQIYQKFTLESDKEKLKTELFKKGYTNAVIKNVSLKPFLGKKNEISIIFYVEKGTPCRIDQVTVDQSYINFLNFIRLPIETGAICNLNSINETLEQLSNQYIDQGYLQSKVGIKNISYSANKENAKLVLEIEKGPKTLIEVTDEQSGLLIFDFLDKQQGGITYADILQLSDVDLKENLINFYKRQGYLFVQIKGPNKTVATNGNTMIKFELKKGLIAYIDKVYFSGELPEKKEKILDDLQLDTGFLNKKILFVQSKLENYQELYKDVFLKNGYSDAEVSMTDFSISSTGDLVNLYFKANAGPQYIVKNILYEGIPVKLLKDSQELPKILKLGSPLNYQAKLDQENTLKELLISQGYLYATVTIQQTLVSQSNVMKKNVSLKYIVNSGPQVKIRNIVIDGDSLNKANAIISISGLETGNFFKDKKIEAARLRILRHDLFSNVSIEPLNYSDLDNQSAEIDIVIRLRAREGYTLAFTPGWGSEKGYKFSTDFVVNKITDDGLKFISSVAVSQELQQQSFDSSDTAQLLGRQFNIGLSEPLFKIGSLTTPLDVTTIAGYKVAAETLSNREYETLKLITDWRPAFFDLNLDLKTQFINESSSATSSESAIVQTLDSPSLILREINNTLILDTRNDQAWPTKGGIYSFQYGFSRFGMGSQIQFNRYTFGVDQFFPIFRKLSGAISIGGSFIRNTINENGETVTPPASRRSSLTDDALVRGFPEGYGVASPGPLLWMHYANNGVSNCKTQLAGTGATNLLFAKVEARYRFAESFGMVLFADSGATYFTLGEEAALAAQIKDQITDQTSSTSNCVVDNAVFIPTSDTNVGNMNFLKQYWDNAYASLGIGFRFILGNFANISFDYGYPIIDPSEKQSGCVSADEALAASTNQAPKCVTRIADSSLYGLFNYKGAIHIGIGAKF